MFVTQLYFIAKILFNFNFISIKVSLIAGFHLKKMKLPFSFLSFLYLFCNIYLFIYLYNILIKAIINLFKILKTYLKYYMNKKYWKF